MGEADLPINKYEAEWASSAVDIGFVNDNYYTLASKGCSNCE